MNYCTTVPNNAIIQWVGRVSLRTVAGVWHLICIKANTGDKKNSFLLIQGKLPGFSNAKKMMFPEKTQCLN